MDRFEFVEARLHNGNVYAVTKTGDLYRLGFGPTNLPEIMLSAAGSATPFRWPDWLKN